MKREPSVGIPVKCPLCRAEASVEFPVIVIITALTVWNNLRLYVNCHDVSWDASSTELDAIRCHLGTEWMLRHRSTVLTSREVTGAGSAACGWQPARGLR